MSNPENTSPQPDASPAREAPVPTADSAAGAARARVLVGAIDPLGDNGFVTGWALNRAAPKSDVKVYVLINGRPVGNALANVFRPDIEAKKLKGGKAGFEIRLSLDDPLVFLAEAGAILTVAFDEAGSQPLTRGSVALDDSKLQMLLREARLNFLDNPFRIFRQLADSLSITQTARMAVWLATRLWLAGNYTALIDFIRRARKLPGYKVCRLELEMLAFAVNFMHDSQVQAKLGKVDGAAYDRSRAPDGRAFTSEFGAAISPCLNEFALFLGGRSASRAPEGPASSLLVDVARVYSLWIDRLYGNTKLALQFLLLVEAHESSHQARYHEILAQHLRRLDRNEEALAHCLHAVRHGAEYWWAYHEASVLLKYFSRTSCPAMRENLASVRSLAHEAFLRNPYQNISVRELDGALDDYHAIAISHSYGLAKSGLVDEALRQRELDLQRIADTLVFRYGTAFSTVDGDLDSRRHAISGHKILLFGSRNLFQCHYYRIQQKLDQLSALQMDGGYLDIDDLASTDWVRILADVAVLVACRVPATAPILRVLAYARGLGIRIIYDIDDLIFDVEAFPPALETYAGTIDAGLHLGLKLDNPYFRVAMKLADAFVVSTAALADEVRLLVGPETPIGILPNLMGKELRFVAQADWEKRRTPGETVEVFYGSATKAHKQCFYDTFLPAAHKLLSNFPQMRLTLVGHFNQSQISRDPRIQILSPTPDFLGYVQLLRRADINIAVLEESRCTDVKSEIKWMEAAAFGIPSVVTPTRAYRDVLTDGEHALFATTVDDWVSQVGRLISEPEFRVTLGEKARNHAFKHFSPETGERIMREQLQPWIPEPTGQRTRKRVLLVNVYFHPQSIGGATRVIESQVRGLLEHHADEYEVFVLTLDADPDGGRPYRIEQYRFGSALVTRISVTQKDWSEYRDPRIYEICEDLFKTYRFDLIHFHCLQMLTASPLEAAIALGIPYMVTVHDAWWLSVHQFLVDKRDQLIDHTDPLGGVTPDDPKAGWIVRRRMDLRQLLGRASAVVAVSEKFARLYREAGIEHCGVHGNISESFQPVARAREHGDKLTLGFIGGMSAHKGMHLLRQALEDGEYPDYRLIVIDHSLQPGERHASIWGKTPVVFRPKVKQSEIARLYAELDALVAPSIWPESFGLVTREAIHAGLWVIASDRGAIGDCIDDGVNGNRISVNDASALGKALMELPANITRVRSEPSAVTQDEVSRELAGHVRQLSEIYQKILVPRAV